MIIGFLRMWGSRICKSPLCFAELLLRSVLTGNLFDRRPPTIGLRRAWGPPIVDLIEHMWLLVARERPTIEGVLVALEKIRAEL